VSIKQCIGIHNNNCTEVALFSSLLCEKCERVYHEACRNAQRTQQDELNRRRGDTTAFLKRLRGRVAMQSNDSDIVNLRRENLLLREALHDAINRPKGVVPESAERFYDPARFYPLGKINE